MIAELTYYQIFWYFLIYAVLGWVVEVAFHALTLGEVVNRGFLNGPVCPIYGCGMVGVLMLSHLAAEAAGMESLGKSLLFLVGLVFCTAAELLVGWAMDKLFHTRWWDYSNMPLNFHGYICPLFSILWGIAVVMAVDLVHPLVANYTAAALPPRYGWPLLALLYAGLCTDLCVTVATILGMNRRLKELDEVNARLRVVSDKMSRVIAENTIKASTRVEEGRVQAALGRAEWKESLEAHRRELEARRAELTAYAKGNVRRLMRAFPQMEHRSYGEAFRDWRRRISVGGTEPAEAAEDAGER